jgi:uncharacterized delta-60 repeat protein
MRKWILWTVVAYIMILMLTRNISFGDGEYRLAIGLLDREFNSGGSTPGIVVDNNAAGGSGNDEGKSIYVDNNGKIYVTGYSSNGGNYDMVIWRYNSIGTLDSSFGRGGIVVHDNAAGKNKVPSVAMENFAYENFANENRPKTNKKSIIEKELSLGKKFEKSLPTKPLVLDPTMLEPIGGDDKGNSIYVDSSGKIYVTGYSFNISSRNKDMTIWRYNSNGTLDTTFDGDGIVVHNNAAGGNGDDEGKSIYVDNNGKIYVTGISYNGRNNDMVIWKYNSDGSLDTSFNGTGYVVDHNAAGGNEDDEGNSIYVDSNGKIYVTGYSYNYKRRYEDIFRHKDMVIWKYNNDGTLDTTFGRYGIVVHYDAAWGNYNHNGNPIYYNDEGKSIYVDSNGKIYVTGISSRMLYETYGSNLRGYRLKGPDMVIWRYNSDGRIDRAFGGGLGYVVHNNAAGGDLDDVGNSMYVDERGEKIYVTGYSVAPLGDADMVIWRYNKNGVLDTTFGEGLGFVVHHGAAGGNRSDYGNSIYVDRTGKIYVTGYSVNRSGNSDMVIWKYR